MKNSQVTPSENGKMSKLQSNPAAVVPKRTIILSVLISIIGAAITFFLEWGTLQLLAGFWLGVIASLINFRLIVINAHKQIEEADTGKKPRTAKGYATRQGISMAAILGGVLMGFPSMIAAFIGLSMVKFAIQLDTFLTFKG